MGDINYTNKLTIDKETDKKKKKITIQLENFNK